VSTTVDPVEVQRRFADYAHYHKHLRIIHRDTRLTVPFNPNRFQRRLYNRVVAARRENRPFRGVVLKARQRGCSTWTQTFLATEAFTKCGVEALTISHEDDSSKKIHAMLERMYDELPAAIKPTKDQREKGKSLALTHGSAITVRTAGSRQSGRSFALTHLHASELAYWPDAGATLTALRQTMQPTPGTFELIESTANGIVDEGQVFHDEWYGAVEGETEYEAIFEPWYADTGYALPAAEGMSETLTDEEKELQRRFGVTLEQVAWRRWKIGTLKSQGGVRKFRQEFPTTPDEAFLVSGHPFFDPERVEAMPIFPPIRTGGWYGLEQRDVAAMRWFDDPTGATRIWRFAHPDRKYVVAVDVAGGVDSDEAEARGPDEEDDYSVCTVVDRSTLEVVAQWRDRVDIGLVGYVAAKLGRIYAYSGVPALLAVEQTGGYGLVVLDALKRIGYAGPQYHREVFDEKTRKMTRKLGWDTTTATRPKVLEGLVDMLREHPERLKSEWLQREMRRFIKGRRPEAAPGHHDDVVMSTAIALEVAREFPHLAKAAA
jgi:hypothetical protein